jgi:hypothetical protein
MFPVLLSALPAETIVNITSYIIVSISALLILGYLIYAFFKPEKF